MNESELLRTIVGARNPIDHSKTMYGKALHQPLRERTVYLVTGDRVDNHEGEVVSPSVTLRRVGSEQERLYTMGTEPSDGNTEPFFPQTHPEELPGFLERLYKYRIVAIEGMGVFIAEGPRPGDTESREVGKLVEQFYARPYSEAFEEVWRKIS